MSIKSRRSRPDTRFKSARALPARAESDRGSLSPRSSRRCTAGARIACGSGHRPTVQGRSAPCPARPGGTGIGAHDAGAPPIDSNSSARTGTAISAAAVGVGARRSAAWSISVVSVSCPTAEISGIGDCGRGADDLFLVERPQVLDRAAAARNDQQVGTRLDRRKASDRVGDAAPPRPRPGPATGHTMTRVGQRSSRRWRMSRITAPVGEVTTPMTRGRNGSLRLRAGIEQPFGGERLAAALEQRQQRALARELHPLDDDLVFRSAGIGRQLAGRDHLRAVFRPESERRPHRSARSRRRCRRSRPSA